MNCCGFCEKCNYADSKMVIAAESTFRLIILDVTPHILRVESPVKALKEGVKL